MKLDCHVIEDLLPLYQDQVCSEESQALVEEHLRDCESCSRLLKAMGEPEERKPIYKDEAKPIEDVSKAVRKIKADRAVTQTIKPCKTGKAELIRAGVSKTAATAKSTAETKTVPRLMANSKKITLKKCVTPLH